MTKSVIINNVEIKNPSKWQRERAKNEEAENHRIATLRDIPTDPRVPKSQDHQALDLPIPEFGLKWFKIKDKVIRL